jgi:hypothetical protein
LDASLLQCARGDPIGFRSLPAQLRLLFAASTVDHGHVSLERPKTDRPLVRHDDEDQARSTKHQAVKSLAVAGT